MTERAGSASPGPAVVAPGPDGGGGGQDAVMINLLIRGSVLLSLFLTDTQTDRQVGWLQIRP